MFWLPVLLIHHPLAASSVTKNVGCFFYILPSCDSAWCTMYGFCWRNIRYQNTLTVVCVCFHPFNTDEVQCPGWMSVVPMKYLMSYSTCTLLKNGEKNLFKSFVEPQMAIAATCSRFIQLRRRSFVSLFCLSAESHLLTMAIHLVEPANIYTSKR